MVDESDLRPEPGRTGIVTESIRKALVTGLSAVFMTEEGIRGALSDLRLPKEAMSYLVQQTQNTRRELFRVISEELKGFLRTADVPAVLRKALSGMKLEIKAEIRFVDSGDKRSGAAEGEENESPPRRVRRRRPRQ